MAATFPVPPDFSVPIFVAQNVTNLEEALSNVLGGEVAMWTEQTDAAGLMARSHIPS